MINFEIFVNEGAHFLNIINEFYVKNVSKKAQASLKLKGNEYLTAVLFCSA